jgi:ribosome assembly protein YihI (activator of Der GTPase)
MNPDEENRLRVKACEILLRYLPDTTAYLDTIDRLERIEQELGIESVGLEDDDDDDSEEDEETDE